jgi:hypothetical protein
VETSVSLNVMRCNITGETGKELSRLGNLFSGPNRIWRIQNRRFYGCTNRCNFSTGMCLHICVAESIVSIYFIVLQFILRYSIFFYSKKVAHIEWNYRPITSIFLLMSHMAKLIFCMHLLQYGVSVVCTVLTAHIVYSYMEVGFVQFTLLMSISVLCDRSNFYSIIIINLKA